MNHYQLPMLPNLVLSEKPTAPGAQLTSVQRDREIAFGFDYNWLGWYGCVLLGSFDSRIVPAGFHLHACAFRWNTYRPWIRLEAAHNCGERLVCFVSDLDREKTLRAFRWLARRNELQWRVDTYDK